MAGAADHLPQQPVSLWTSVYLQRTPASSSSREMRFSPFRRFVQPPAAVATLELFPVVHMVDQIWSDRYGVFVRGWIHAYEHKVQEIALVSGDLRVATQNFQARPDLLTHYPDHAHV